MKSKANILFVFIFFLCSWLITAPCFSQEKEEKPEEFAGEFSGWGVKVPRFNYILVYGAVSVFGTRWGAQPKTEEELQNAIWEQLLLSFEAYRRGVKVEDSEVEAELDKILKSEKVSFDRKKDRDTYEKWIRERTKESAELFENQLRHLIQLENLRKLMLDSFSPQVTEEEAFQEFRIENNMIDLELVQFDSLEDAKAFFKKMKNPAKWVSEGKKDPKFAKRPGFVAFEFLNDMWKIPREDLYKMIALKEDSIYPPTPIYKGYGVFRILKKRPANEGDFPKEKESYIKQVESIKKYQELKSWLEKLKEEAKITVYPAEKKAAEQVKPQE